MIFIPHVVNLMDITVYSYNEVEFPFTAHVYISMLNIEPLQLETYRLTPIYLLTLFVEYENDMTNNYVILYYIS